MASEYDVDVASTVNNWALMGSWAPMITIFTAYLLFVLKIGPEYMRNRKPMNLTNFTRCYNVFQVIACISFIVQFHRLGYSFQSTWQCLPPDNNIELQLTQWWFLMLRLAELTETVIFVLRKKQNQVSKLHVYHHIATAFVVWSFCKYTLTPMGLHTGAVNSLIHIIMYSYYFLSSFKTVSSMLSPIKPFITVIQIVQLVVIFGQGITGVLPSCQATKLFYFQIANAGILIYFFVEFYASSYLKNKKQN